jgi:site-specific recombinase XerC
MSELLAFHAQELAPYMRPPGGPDAAGTDPTVARQLAEQTAAYAMAAFDPQDAVDAMFIRSIVMTGRLATLRPDTPKALTRQLRSTAGMLTKSLQQRQVRMRMRDALPIPGRRRKTPRQLEAPPVMALPEGVAHWLELITDRTLRRRLEPG